MPIYECWLTPEETAQMPLLALSSPPSLCQDTLTCLKPDGTFVMLCSSKLHRNLAFVW